MANKAKALPPELAGRLLQCLRKIGLRDEEIVTLKAASPFSYEGGYSATLQARITDIDPGLAQELIALTEDDWGDSLIVHGELALMTAEGIEPTFDKLSPAARQVVAERRPADAQAFVEVQQVAAEAHLTALTEGLQAQRVEREKTTDPAALLAARNASLQAAAQQLSGGKYGG